MVYVIKLPTNSDPNPYPLHKLSIHTSDNLLTDSLQVYDYYDFL